MWKALEWAEERNLVLVIYTSWVDFVYSVFFWSNENLSTLLTRSTEAILLRLQELEVSRDGIAVWTAKF